MLYILGKELFWTTSYTTAEKNCFLPSFLKPKHPFGERNSSGHFISSSQSRFGYTNDLHQNDTLFLFSSLLVVVASSNALVEQKATDHKRERKFLIAPENGRNGEIRSAGENGRERERTETTTFLQRGKHKSSNSSSSNNSRHNFSPLPWIYALRIRALKQLKMPK
jgi:hypothetical protein